MAWAFRSIPALAMSALLPACAQPPAPAPATDSPTPTPPTESAKMITVEILSDVVCPFCYIGKREFESALARFPERDQVRVIWRSFELDPGAPARSPHDMYGMLVEKYGGTRADAKARVDGVVQRARTVGLAYEMDKAIIGSSFHAHRVLQFAKTKGRGDAMKERLFRGYFMEGVHLADIATLVRLASEAGLDGTEVEQVLNGSAFADAVRADEQEARRIGVRGVPFFLIDERYTVSGAQTSEVFLNALGQAWQAR